MSYEVAEQEGIAAPYEPAQHGSGLAYGESTVRQAAGHTSENTTSRQWAKEADRVERENSRCDRTYMKDALVPRDEVIVSQAEHWYEPPDFLRKTCRDDEYEQLRGLLGELREVNRCHVGECSREVEACLTLTGESMDIAERFRQWIHSYLDHRVSTPNPRDNGDPFGTFMRLHNEYFEMLGNVGALTGSIHYAFLETACYYALWFLYDRLLRGSISVSSGEIHILGTPSDPRKVNQVIFYLQELGWQHDALGHTIGAAKAAVGEECLARIGANEPTVLVERLAEMAADIQQMRPFLLEGFHPEKAAVPTGDGQFLVWNWYCRQGMATIALSDTAYECSKALHKLNAINIVRTDGVLIDYHLTWRAATDLADPQALALNYYVLHAFWEKLYSFYEKIDLERIRGRASRADACTPVDDRELALSCSDLACAENGHDPASSRKEPIGKSQRLRPLSLPRLLRFLERHFACEVRQGKGSERVAYRNGQHIFRFGCHGANPIVPLERLSAALTRLGITRSEWCRAVYGEV